MYNLWLALFVVALSTFPHLYNAVDGGADSITDNCWPIEIDVQSVSLEVGCNYLPGSQASKLNFLRKYFPWPAKNRLKGQVCTLILCDDGISPPNDKFCDKEVCKQRSRIRSLQKVAKKALRLYFHFTPIPDKLEAYFRISSWTEKKPGFLDELKQTFIGKNN